MTDMPPPPPPPSGNAYPETSQATLALILGILGIVMCGLAAPFAWWLGKSEVDAIDAGRRPPEGRSNANAGKILGMVGTGLLILAIVAIGAFIALGIFSAIASSSY